MGGGCTGEAGRPQVDAQCGNAGRCSAPYSARTICGKAALMPLGSRSATRRNCSSCLLKQYFVHLHQLFCRCCRSYTKFLVDQNGVARKRYKPTFNPADFDGGALLGMGSPCSNHQPAAVDMRAVHRRTARSSSVRESSACGGASCSAGRRAHRHVYSAEPTSDLFVLRVLPPALADVARLLAGKEPLPAECIAHPGRKVCKVDA